MFEPWLHDPKKVRLLHHEQGLAVNAGLAKVYTNQEYHDPANLDRAREMAASMDPIPVGILYRNPEVPCYEELRASPTLRTAGLIKRGLEAEFDKFTVWPDGMQPQAQGAA
jgi:2-oxoglutarate ferredoxin oxidoreductase subunit beta